MSTGSHDLLAIAGLLTIGAVIFAAVTLWLWLANRSGGRS